MAVFQQMDKAIGKMGKIMMVIPNGLEADLMYPVYRELVDRGCEVINIDLGELCCDKDMVKASMKLAELGMSRKLIYDYKTRSATRILKFEQPDVLVVGSDQEYVRRAFVYAAKGLGIPVLLIDVAFGSNLLKGHWLVVRRTLYRLSYHLFVIVRKYLYILRTVMDLGWSLKRIIGMILSDVGEAFVVEDARGLYGCNKIVVAGEWNKDVLIERGVIPDRIVVTGNPRMAMLLRDKNEKGEKGLRDELGIRDGEKVILFATSAQVEHGRWDLAMRKDFINRVLDSLSPLVTDGAKVILRIHPAENMSEYEDIIKDRTDGVILRKGISFIDTVGISDVAIFNAYSTMVLEVTALGKPAVLLNTFNEVKNLPYEEMGLAVCLYDYNGIGDTVRSLLYDDAFRNNFLNHVQSFYEANREFVDGKSSERIADVICGLESAK